MLSPYSKMVVYLSLGLLLVFAWHFSTVLGFVGTAPVTKSEFFIRLGVILVGFFVVSVIAAIKVGSSDERAALPDEREEKVELKSERFGLIMLYAGLLVVLWFAFTPLSPIQIANAVLAAVCVSELTKLIYALCLLKWGV